MLAIVWAIWLSPPVSLVFLAIALSFKPSTIEIDFTLQFYNRSYIIFVHNFKFNSIKMRSEPQYVFKNNYRLHSSGGKPPRNPWELEGFASCAYIMHANLSTGQLGALLRCSLRTWTAVLWVRIRSGCRCLDFSKCFWVVR